MKRKPLWYRTVSICTAILLAFPLPTSAQYDNVPPGQAEVQQKRFSPEELAQLTAPIALYPDELVSQILMAATYPLEIVEADRWVQKNKGLNSDVFARALEEQKWDPSVKSLANFPSVLSMMSQKLDVTSRLGDAFLSQEADVMATIQSLRKRAYEAGYLTSSPEQNVVVEKETVIIKPADPQIVYVPTYNPTVVYGPWLYPAYPPYYYYPPPAYGFYTFAVGVTIGLAWGYAWGGCNWAHHSVNVNVYRNVNVHNTYINRNTYVSHYQNKGYVNANGQGTWRHDPSHRRGVAYRDGATARQYGQPPGRVSPASRDVRGYGDRGRGTMPQQGARTDRRAAATGPKSTGGRPVPSARVPDNRSAVPPSTRSEPRTPAPGGRAGTGTSYGTTGGRPADHSSSGGNRGSISAPSRRDSAFSGGNGDGNSARSASERGRYSREQSMPSGGFGGDDRSWGGSGGGRSGGRHR